MYNEDHRSQTRMNWTFRYLGRELLPHARRKYIEYQVNERSARERMAIMIKDPSTFHDDRELQKVKEDIDRLSAVREQLEVHLLEFERSPEARYTLHMSDVVFYGAHLMEDRAWLEESDAAWAAIEKLDSEIERTRAEREALHTAQERLMGFLGRLKQRDAEGALRARYLERLDALHTRYIEREARLEQLEATRRERHDEAWTVTRALSAPGYRVPEIRQAER